MNTPDAAELRSRVVSHADPGTATRVLDIGCGTGVDLRAIAAEASPSARLIGVDTSSEALAAAANASRDDRRLSFVRADASSNLPFADQTFDRILSVNLLECVPDRLALLREVHRVLRPEGLVVFAHFDWDSQMFDGPDKGPVRKLVHSFADWRQPWMAASDGWMGRRLWGTFQASELFTGTVHPLVLSSTRYEPDTYGWQRIQDFSGLVRHGDVTAEEYQDLLATTRELAANDRYFYSITMFVYVGRSRAR